MPEQVYEKENIIQILEKTKEALISKDSLALKELSNRTVHSASIHQDTDSIAVAVLVHALFKIVERPDLEKYKDWPVFVRLVNINLESAASNLEKGKTDAFRKNLSEIRRAMTKLSGHLKRYIEEVFRKAMISKASRIYEHGISMEQTASLLGITVFELAEYAGTTGISDVDLSRTIAVEKRIKTATEFFS